MRTRMSAMRRNYQLVACFEVHRRFSVANFNQDIRSYFTMRQIAFWANVKPSSYLKRKLDELVTAGWLEREERPYRRGLMSHHYRITDNGVKLISELTPLQSQLL